MNLSKRLIKALRSAEHRAYPDMEAVNELDQRGFIAINTINQAITITQTGKQALKQWESENEVRI